MPSIADDLQDRAQRFGCRILTFLRTLPHDPVATTIVRQCARSGSGIASNYRATRRSRSRAEFVARLAVVVEEADETVLWLQQIRDVGVAEHGEFDWLLGEAAELLAIFSRSLTTARRRHHVATRPKS